MPASARIAKVIDAFIGNPFDVASNDRRAAAEVVDGLDLASAIVRLVDRGEVESPGLSRTGRPRPRA